MHWAVLTDIYRTSENHQALTQATQRAKPRSVFGFGLSCNLGTAQMGLGSGPRCFSFLGRCCSEFWQQTVVSSGGAAFHIRVHGVQASLCRIDLGSVNEKNIILKITSLLLIYSSLLWEILHLPFCLHSFTQITIRKHWLFELWGRVEKSCCGLRICNSLLPICSNAVGNCTKTSPAWLGADCLDWALLRYLLQAAPQGAATHMYSKGSHLWLWIFVSCLSGGVGICTHQFVFIKCGRSPANAECKYRSLHDTCCQKKKK